MSPDSLEYFAVDPRAITRRYEKRDRPVTISSDSPSARAFNSTLVPAYLNGSTATQKPSLVRLSPDAVCAGTVTDDVRGDAAAPDGVNPALPRSPSICSTISGCHQMLRSSRARAAKSGRAANNARSALRA